MDGYGNVGEDLGPFPKALPFGAFLKECLITSHK